MNDIKLKLERVLGSKLPKTARSFCTNKDSAWFVNSKGQMMERKLSKAQIEQLKQEKLLGSLGWSLS